jgi:hypothetical protein
VEKNMNSEILQLTSQLYDELTQREEKDYDLQEFGLTESDIQPFFLKSKKIYCLNLLSII